MEKYKSLLEDIENVSNQNVKKQNQISILGIGLIGIAIGCAVAAKGFEDPNSSLPTFFFTVSALLLLSGIIKIFVSRTCYLFTPTKSKLQSFTIYFDAKDGINLQNSLEISRLNDLNLLKKKKDGAIKLETMITNDGSFAALQVLEYIPYSYEAVTPVICYYGEQAKHLSSYIKS